MQRRQNIYDLVMDMGDFFTISYMIIPIFAIVLTLYYSRGSIQNYMLFRYKSKQSWFRNNVIMIGQIATALTLAIFIILTSLSIFVLDKTNRWSTYTINLYQNIPIDLFEGKPLIYAIGTVILIWFLLIFIGICFLLIFTLTKKTMIAFLSIILLDLVNVVITIMKLDSLSKFIFTFHVDALSFQGLHKLEAGVFPFQIFIYWFIIIACVFLLGLYLINRRDLWIEKGENNNGF